MNFKFKVGDRVRILDGSKIENYTGKWTPLMCLHIDKIVTIGDCFEMNGLPAYHVKEIGYSWDERGLVSIDHISAIKKVIFNDPATIVIWSDDSKTVVKCQPGDTYSKELGLAMCISKKFLGNKGNFNEEFKKWIPEETISVEEMRKLLLDHCNNIGFPCSKCKLYNSNCGNGVSFKTKDNNGVYHMTDDEIRDAYKIVFGDKED